MKLPQSNWINLSVGEMALPGEMGLSLSQGSRTPESRKDFQEGADENETYVMGCSQPLGAPWRAQMTCSHLPFEDPTPGQVFSK